MATFTLSADFRQTANFYIETINGSAQVRPGVFGAYEQLAVDFPLGAAIVQNLSEIPIYSVRIKNNSEAWVDVASYLTKMSIKRSVGDTYHKIKGGEAKLTLFNECQSFGALFGAWNPFSGVGQVGSFSDLARPYRALEVTAAWSLYSYPIFYGTVKDIRIETGKDNDVSITAVDQLQNVFDKDIVQSYQAWNNGQVHVESFVQVYSLQNFPVMSLFKTFMPTSYGYATIGVSCDAGVGSWSVYMNFYNSEDKAEAVKELVEFGGFAVYATVDGSIRVRDGIHKATSYFPFSEMTGRYSQAMKVDVKIDRFDMINKVMCKLAPSAPQSTGVSVPVFQINSPIAWEKPIGQSSYYLDFWMESLGVEGANQNKGPVKPRPGYGAFYLQDMSTSPAGHADHINIYIYGSRARVVSTLNSAGTINSLNILGQPYYFGADMLATAENSDSQSQYETHKDEFENRFWNTWSAANHRAITICSERAFPPIEVTAQLRNLFPQILQIDLLDRLFIPQVVPTSKCVRVYEITHDINVKRGTIHSVTYRTEVDTFIVSS